MTIIYNKDKQKVLARFKDRYKIDGKPQAVDPPLYELIYATNERPTPNKYQRVIRSVEVDVDNLEYIVTYELEDFTEEEIIAVRNSEAESREQEINLIPIKRKMVQDFPYELTFYPYYRVGVPYELGDKFQYEGVLYEVIQAHTSQADWEPDVLPALYKVFSDDECPDWVQPTGGHDAYNTGDKAFFEGNCYESEIDGNVWAPDVHGWKLA